MAVLATDTFTRADGASLGANWTVAKGVTEELGILTNQAKQTTAGNTAGDYYSAVAAPNDQYSQAVVVALTNYWLGVTVRSITTGASRNAYVAGHDVGDFGGLNTTSRVWKEIAGVTTSLGTGSTALAAGQTWYLEVQGTQLIMKINGVQEISTPGTGLSAGQFGIQSFNTGTGGIAVFDTWEGGDFSSTTSGKIIGNTRIASRNTGSAAQRFSFRHPVTPMPVTEIPTAAISSAGAAVGTFGGQSQNKADISAAGAAAATFTGAATDKADISAAGVALATFTGAATDKADLSMTGQAVGTFNGAARDAADISMTGQAVATFTGAGTGSAPLSVIAQGAATLAGAAVAKADLAMTGQAVATFTGSAASGGSGDLSITGSASAIFAAAALAGGSFQSQGAATAAFTSSAATTARTTPSGTRRKRRRTQDERDLADMAVIELAFRKLMSTNATIH